MKKRGPMLLPTGSFVARAGTILQICVVASLALTSASCVAVKPPPNQPLYAEAGPSPKCEKFRESLALAANQKEITEALDGSKWAPCIQYRPGIVASPEGGPDNTEDLLVLVAVSGGAKRSAAFSYGVFKKLHEAFFSLNGQQRNVLEEVDIMSAASGGAMTASFYALHRDKMFEPWPNKRCSYEAFLKENTGGEIWKLYLEPWKWGWVLDKSYGSNDLMANFYAERLFGFGSGECARQMAANGERPYGATYGDLYAKGPPVLMLQSTDITQSIPFPLIQDSFDTLCSDMTDYPLAWAVAASNGFPVVLSTIALENHHASQRQEAQKQGLGSQPLCKPQGNSWLNKTANAHSKLGCNGDEFLEGEDTTSDRTFFRGDLLGVVASCRLWPENGSYIHLADGGLMDNMALHGLTDWLQTHTDLSDPVMWSIVLNTRRVQLLIVDGQSATNQNLAEHAVGPNLWDSLGTMVSTTVEQGNLDSLVQAEESLLILSRLMMIRDVVMLEQSLGSEDYDRFEALLCPAPPAPAPSRSERRALSGHGKAAGEGEKKAVGSDEPCAQGRMAIPEFEGRQRKFITEEARINNSAARAKIAGYFRLNVIGGHDPLVVTWKKEDWERYTTLKRKLRLLVIWNSQQETGSTQNVRISLADDCNSQRRARLLASDTGLGIDKNIVSDAIAAGEEIAARHLSKVTKFLETGETQPNPDCGVWLGQESIERGADPPEVEQKQ